jgi:uncharacterized membrane protein
MRAVWAGLFVLAAGQAEAGLTLCNDAATRASVAIAYAADGVWTTEGWWGIDPGACTVVLGGDLTQRNYYYSLSGDAGFTGDGYSFCTKAEAFTLPGADGDCAALAGEARPFAHIDTGPEAKDFTFRIAAVTAPVPEQAPAKEQSAAAPAAPSASGPSKPGAAAAGSQGAANPARMPVPKMPAPSQDASGLMAAAAIPSFERGLMGEPFYVSAILQGCGPTEVGGTGCTFYAEGARWIADAAGQSNPAAMRAMAALPQGTALFISGDLIFFGDITAEAAIASIEPGQDPYAADRAAMQGAWVSADDPQARIEIAGSEQTDIYGSELLGVSVMTLSDACGGAKGGVLLSVQQMGGDPADQLCYEVLSVTDSRMELLYLGRGSALVYVRP